MVDNIIFDVYKFGLYSVLLNAYNILQEEKDINERYKSFQNKLEIFEDGKSNLSQQDTELYNETRKQIENFENLITDGYVTKEDDKLIINRNLKETLCKFVTFTQLIQKSN